MKYTNIFTSESVGEGHPDKVADLISDSILDACLAQDPASRVACETLVKDNHVVLAGEITTKAVIDYEKIVRDTIAEIGYRTAADDALFNAENVDITNYLSTQSPDIAQGVDAREAEGKEGAELIQKMMVDFRENPPKTIVGSPVVKINDYQKSETLDVVTGTVTPIEEDKSNVLQWFTEDGTIVSVRPSGTEPKIKFYFGVKAELPSVAEYEKVEAELDAKIEAIKAELELI